MDAVNFTQITVTCLLACYILQVPVLVVSIHDAGLDIITVHVHYVL